MSRALKLGSCVVLWALLVTSPLAGASLRAGVAKVDITPPPGLPMYGYFSRIKNNQLSTGTLDPLYARVLVLEVGKERLALVTLDLGRTFGQPLLDELRQAAGSRYGISYLIVTASHTHSGPNILDAYPGGQTPAWETAALQKIESAIGKASHHLVAAQLGTGYSYRKVYIGYNRRQVNPDGSVTMLWSNPNKEPTEPQDPTVSVLRVDRADGKPLAILVNYACHPVIFGPDNLQYSADYPGVMTKVVEQAFGGRPLCFFLQGGDGDINPYYATTPRNQGAVQKRDWTGEQLGQEAARVAKAIHTQASPTPSLDFADDVMTFRLRWNPEKFREGLLLTDGPKVFEDHADLLGANPPPDHLQLHVTTLLINKQIAFVGMPGEPFVDFQIDWRKLCPARDAFFLGYTNGYFDYFPTIRAASQGGYGAGDSDTYVEVGAGERMLRQALVRVYEMLGRLHDVPESH
ncbi:MAG: neutral/alkaline non-lysosomal ceramidase N-terminal domain-containing protein [Terriglobia bacterium]